MPDYLDTSGDTGPTSDSNTNFNNDGSTNDGGGNLSGYLTTASTLGSSILNYLGKENTANANAAIARQRTQQTSILARVTQTQWTMIAVASVAIAVAGLLILRRK